MIKIPLTQGLFATIDDEDGPRIKQHKWCAIKARNGNYYAITNISNPAVKPCYQKKNGKIYGPYQGYKRLWMHDEIMNPKPGQVVDHKDGNGIHNQKHNMRTCSQRQNTQNSRKSKSFNGQTTLSKYKGVYWNKAIERWHSRISVSKRRIHLGYFKSEIEAAIAYNKAAIKYFGEFANLNKI